MENKSIPTPEQIESFNKNFSLSVEVHGQASLIMKPDGKIVTGEAEDLDECGRSHCTFYLGDDYEVSFEAVKYTDELLMELIRRLHDKTIEEALAILKSDEFPYNPNF